MDKETPQTTCGAASCRLLGTGRDAVCVPGSPGTCFIGLRECKVSETHDEKLVAATAAINNIINDLNKGSDPKKATFFVSQAGIILVWAKHGDNPDDIPDDAVSAESDLDTIISEFGIKT
ncbi:MAG: hypothetical protein R2681_14350 [Pyrinomonadaceae bacterium]